MYEQVARHPAVLVALTAAGLGVGKIGLFLSDGVGTPAVWVPSGFGLAALVLFGRRAWPAVAAGAFLTYFTAPGDFLPALTSGAAHAIVLHGRAGGITLQIRDGFDGFLVDSVDECAARILDLLADPVTADAFGAQGREHVRANFLSTRELVDWLQLFTDLAD